MPESTHGLCYNTGKSMRRLLILIVILVILLAATSSFQKLHLTMPSFVSPNTSQTQVKVVTEESVVTDAVKKYGPSVITVSEQLPQQQSLDLGPFQIFGLEPDENQDNQPQDIGSGFIVSSDGLIVTNKHVVSDTSGTYKVSTSNDKTYDVQKIYRDPLNDVAILKIDPSAHPENKLMPVAMGDSSKLQVGQFVIAIGTALGEFRNTVTTGVISGLGRGIVAGSRLQGMTEELSNVIQTDAAINPGNSGGPLLNSSAQVIGINTAVSQAGQNIGFALPINVVKDSLDNFNQTGQFNRPYLGIAYEMVTPQEAAAQKIPQGALVQQVVPDSAADSVGIQQDDIITKIDGQPIPQNGGLAQVIAKKKVGDSVTLTIYRDSESKTFDVDVTLGTAPSQ